MTIQLHTFHCLLISSVSNADLLFELLPWFVAMLLLVVFSAFFSASEAAMFYLRPQDRRELSEGNRAQRAAAVLLQDPDRLLSAVLFWNLVINLTFFAISAIIGLRLQNSEKFGRSTALAFAFGSLLAIIFFSEMMPKSFAVLRAKWLASVISFPLAVAIRLVDPLMPVLRFINVISRRLIWPGFKPEAQLEISDLERAIELSTTDAHLVEQERTVLRNIVMLSEIRADEWMRPRTQFQSFRPPTALADLGGKMTPSGYLLLTESDSEEIASSINLERVCELPDERLEHYAEPVVITPWCATVADVLEKMQRHDREVAAVVNEYGETIGILTFEDILDTIFNFAPSRSKRLLDRNPIHPIEPNKWLVAGVLSLRRLARYLNVELPTSKSITVGGVVQEMLGKLAEVGDECEWGPFHFRVLETPHRGHLLIELVRMTKETKNG